MCFQWKFFEICILELFSIDLLDSGGIEESICFKAVYFKLAKNQKMSSKTKITGMKNLTKPQNLVISVCVEPLFGCYLNLKLFGQKKLLMHEI